METNPKISYLITASTEIETLNRLLERVYSFLDKGDEMVILTDADSLKPETWNIIDNYLKMDCENKKSIVHYSQALEKNYSQHKNYGMSLCHLGDFIMQIDADECPTETLLLNIKDIIKANPGIEAFWIPRINAFKGLYDIHANKWGWRLTPSQTIVYEKIIDSESDEYKYLKNNGYILEETEIG